MTRYERILICIEQPERDAHMLAYVAAITRLAGSKCTYVVHVSEKPAHIAGDSPGDLSTDAEICVDTLQELAAEHFAGPPACECECEVLSGAPLIEILRYAYEKDVDLIVIGRHPGDSPKHDDEAMLARRITRKATCSVLVLPEDCPVKADTLLVPVRDSKCSANALDVACDIAAATNATVVALNVYQVHAGYSRVGTTLEEHQSLLKAAARRECDQLLARVDTHSLDLQCKTLPDISGGPVPIILDEVENSSADLVVIGARGRTGAAGVLLGKVTEQLIRKSPVPVLGVKNKGECIGVLRALLTIAGQE